MVGFPADGGLVQSVTGTTALGNGSDGVRIWSSGNTVGGTAAGAGNVISGNGTHGVHIIGPRNLVQGNRIGTDVTGTRALGNDSGGVDISTSENTVGRT